MKKLLLALMCITVFGLSGCDNLSPRLRQQMDNQNGRIGEIENNQDTIKNEMMNLKNDNQIQDSQLDHIQQGLINSQNNNNGIQILSGNGGLLLGLIGIVSLFLIMLHYRQRAITHEKAADILAETVVSHDDPALADDVFKAAMYTDAEETMLHLVSKHQQRRFNQP